MPHVEFTSQLAQHVECPAGLAVEASSLSEMLDVLFNQYPLLRDYVMEDDGTLRQHISIFVDGEMLASRDQWDQAVSEKSEIFVMQALSGG